MKKFVETSLRIDIKAMKIVCLYPPANYKKISYVLAILLYSCCVILVPVLTVINYCLQETLDIEQLNNNGVFLAEAFGYIIKVLPFFLYGKRVKNCIQFFDNSFFDPRNTEDMGVIEECARTVTKNCKLFTTIIVIGLISFIIKPLFWEGFKYPLDMWLPFDSKESLKTYCAVYLLIVCAATAVGLFGPIVDPVIGGLICFATAHIRVLKQNLEKTHTILENKTSNQHDAYIEICRCIIYHNSILTFLSNFQECFSWVIFSQFAGTMGGVSFCCVQLAQVSMFSFDAFSSFVFIICILGQIYFYCYYGSLLYDENKNLGTGVYMGCWYKLNVKCRRALIILMEKSKKPIIIYGGYLLPLTLTTFTKVVKTIYSLIAVIKTYQ